MKNSIYSLFRPCIILSILLFISCSPSKKKTFLDFELGMTYEEYMEHANNLYKSKNISRLNANEFDYSIKLKNKYIFFRVHAFVDANLRLSMIEANSIFNLSDNEKVQLYNIFVKNKGETNQPYYENGANDWIAVWGNKDIDERLVFMKDDIGWKTTFIYMATGGLSDNIDELDKKENGYIDVENKF